MFVLSPTPSDLRFAGSVTMGELVSQRAGGIVQRPAHFYFVVFSRYPTCGNGDASNCGKLDGFTPSMGLIIQ